MATNPPKKYKKRVVLPLVVKFDKDFGDRVLRNAFRNAVRGSVWDKYPLSYANAVSFDKVPTHSPCKRFDQTACRKKDWTKCWLEDPEGGWCPWMAIGESDPYD